MITTTVQQTIENVWKGFNQDLFLKLSPPLPPVRLLRYDGNNPPDEIHLELDFLFGKQVWISVIIEQKSTTTEIYFVDEGRQLPFFLSYWWHKHRIVKTGSVSQIIDEIEFRTPTLLTDYFFYPILYAQFWYRKPIYQKIFS